MVRCTNCLHEYKEDDLLFEKDLEDLKELQDGEDDSWTYSHCCPTCHTDHHLMDLDLDD